MRWQVHLATTIGVAVTVGVLYGSPSFAQQRGDPHAQQQHAVERPRANQGHVPPPPPARGNRGEVRQPERLPSGHVNEVPHVNHDQ